MKNHNPGILPFRTYVFFEFIMYSTVLGSICDNKNKTGNNGSVPETRKPREMEKLRNKWKGTY